jgi:hypothetical protein
MGIVSMVRLSPRSRGVAEGAEAVTTITRSRGVAEGAEAAPTITRSRGGCEAALLLGCIACTVGAPFAPPRLRANRGLGR